jgi:hypothetical protein
VLDNTCPTRKQRNEVIEAAWQRGAPVRCVWLATSVADAQINSIQRMIEVHGSLPTPEAIRARGKSDTRYLGPDAQFRYERTLEPPTIDEGFTAVESRAFVRTERARAHRAVIVDFDALASIGDALRQRHRDGWRLFAHAWRPGASAAEVEREFESARIAFGIEIDLACCTHEAGPPVCWCRKPIPGSVLEFAARRDVALDRSVVVASSAADKTMGERLGAMVVDG